VKENKAMRNAVNTHLKKDLISFVRRGFEELNPEVAYLHNWHIDEICNNLIDVYLGLKTRLIIAMPPRYLKSICISVCFPAWILGKDPRKRIIVSSYSAALSNKHSMDTKKIIQSDWYKVLFPETIILKGQNQKNKFVTSFGGFRIATSSGGTLTGEGGDILIVDDPHKPLTIKSKLQRNYVTDWFENTFVSRLNNKKTGGIVIVMQRLHSEDLIGFLLKKKKHNWTLLILKAIAEDDEIFRKKGEVLHEAREDLEDLKNLALEIGEREFTTQYQQSPTTENEGIFSKKHLILSEIHLQEKDFITISVDSASKIGIKNDFTAITIWIIREEKLLLLEAFRIKLEFGDLFSFLKSLILKYLPKFIIIEDKSSGIGLIQELEKEKLEQTSVVALKVKASKEIRLLNVILYFERRMVEMNKNIPIISEIISELLAFPNSKHDDIVDSIVNFLTWHNSSFKNYKKVEPKIRNL
jgi:predicted phage terminase large subunit-like protein